MGCGRREERVGAVVLAAALFLWTEDPLRAQSLMNGSGSGPTLIGSDMAVLEARDVRKDLPCVVTPTKPVLGFDLKFHSGYEITVPMRELAGPENMLTILFRVASEEKKESPLYFTQKIRVPSIEEDAKGEAYLQGTFDLGEGKYQVDWLMRDRAERVCASFWDSEAALSAKDKALELNLKAGDIAASDKEEFIDEPFDGKVSEPPALSVKVLVNFAPQNSSASTLQPADTTALVSILRSIQRDPHIHRFSVVAFNLQEQKILYRQDASDHIDFPAIGEALRGLQLGRVNFEKLQQKNSDTEFLSNLIQNELKKADGNAPDAVIIAGPKVMLNENVPSEALKTVGEPEYPLFYMNYNLYPQLTPWRDSIGQAVKYFKGQEFTISRPRDLWFAVSEMVSKIVKFKGGKRTASAAAWGPNEVSAH